ncbi:MAG: PfkB family carbohydrate kinase [Devosia sp.]|nr:PfkB family carbohydrate kinase [Devosia sp.]
MAEGRDLIVAAALIDTLVFADGRAEAEVPGGAGLYALSGAALFSDHALLVTGTGEDLPFGPWLDRNGLDRSGLRFADPHTPRNLLRYLDDRTRTETPVFGEAHFHRVEPHAGDIEKLVDGARSAYIFRNTEPEFWDGVIRLRAARDFVLLWEIGLDACSPQERPAIERLLDHVDALSLNLEEAGLIFSVSGEEAVLQRLADWPVETIFLRVGGRGSHVITNGDAHFIPSLPVAAVDVTGGGNAYSGAALVGLAERRGAVTAAAMGTVAASIAIGQLGLPEPGDPEVRALAGQRLAGLVTAIEKEMMA